MSLHLHQAIIDQGLRQVLDVPNHVFMKKDGGGLATVTQKTATGEQNVSLVQVDTLHNIPHESYVAMHGIMNGFCE